MPKRIIVKSTKTFHFPSALRFPMALTNAYYN